MLRTLAMLALSVAGTMSLAATQATDKKVDSHSHDGVVVSTAAGKLVMTGKDKKEHSHDVLATAKITVDGKVTKLDALKKGTAITVTTDKEGKVTAITSGAVTTKPHAKLAPAAPVTPATKAPAKSAATPVAPSKVTTATPKATK